jgi:hypothetical protein
LIHTRRKTHRALGATFTHDQNLIKVATRPAFFKPKVTGAFPGIAVHERLPVDVADMPSAAGPHKADRHNWLAPLELIDERAAGQ